MAFGTMKKIALIPSTSKTVKTASYPIKSDSSKAIYHVTLSEDGEAMGCTCPAGKHNRPCKHLFRAQVKHSGAWSDAKVASGFDAAIFVEGYKGLAANLGVNKAIEIILDQYLPADDRRRISHKIGDWRKLL